MNMEVMQIAVSEVEKTAAEMKNQGYRLVVMTCTPAVGGGFDITYSFDKDLALKHFRITMPAESEIPSICGSFAGAFVYENEIHDLYGFVFNGMTIDFKGTFIRTSVPYPFKKEIPEPTVTKVKKEDAA
ncbi:MAG: NADH-quinone oxidoreductase subunit C [Methanocorpusculum sp.]|nr:NADH-quinone oxidoreductase subunit C [Methanocorpusculum parvum]MBQ2771503.1 NADH-quinone oxidoreductase subunit C [Methanocorpusculum sp.]MBQ4134773.1 NADH-quinone oxidoreductase subunit C [Methanocorpusculum sp.]MBR4117656.1 NADH-quinone oxidoreductase subunit C [Methanocorpusculum sp.]HJJ63603.1 NADH-quinone oxidoreductase subunit C [Methanocorpusculum sp.]